MIVLPFGVYQVFWLNLSGCESFAEFCHRLISSSAFMRRNPERWNLAFGMCLHNMWWLVDFLVQLSMEEGYDFSLDITSKEFRNCAKENFDFRKPPPSAAAAAV